MGPPRSNRLRVAAIDFLNPAPLMWDFEHAPVNAELAERYSVHYTMPSQCADDILAGRADLGLIPIASLTKEMAIVPGCTIASLDRVRSIQLIIKIKGNQGKLNRDRLDMREAVDSTHHLAQVRSIAADTASRSSLVYAQVLFRRFIGTNPKFIPTSADPIPMLEQADAALVIGDPALLALEDRGHIEHAVGPCAWIDLAHDWRLRTGLPWVAAVWAIRAEACNRIAPERLVEDLEYSRDNGLAHIDTLVEEWKPRITIPSETIRHYLTQNIYYNLSPDCIAAIELLRRYAAEADILPSLHSLRFL